MLFCGRLAPDEGTAKWRRIETGLEAHRQGSVISAGQVDRMLTDAAQGSGAWRRCTYPAPRFAGFNNWGKAVKVA